MKRTKEKVKRCFFCEEGILQKDFEKLPRVLGSNKRCCLMCWSDFKLGKRPVSVKWEPPSDLKEMKWPPNLSP